MSVNIVAEAAARFRSAHKDFFHADPVVTCRVCGGVRRCHSFGCAAGIVECARRMLAAEATMRALEVTDPPEVQCADLARHYGSGPAAAHWAAVGAKVAELRARI